MSDNRRAPRRRCLIGAKVVLKEQASTINCVVRSLSETGAKIGFETIQLLPQQFTLRLDTAAEYSVESIAWQRDKQIGVIFRENSSVNSENVFSQNRLSNAAAFQDEISTQAPVVASTMSPISNTPIASSAGQDFALEYRKRMAALQHKPK